MFQGGNRALDNTFGHRESGLISNPFPHQKQNTASTRSSDSNYSVRARPLHPGHRVDKAYILAPAGVSPRGVAQRDRATRQPRGEGDPISTSLVELPRLQEGVEDPTDRPVEGKICQKDASQTEASSTSSPSHLEASRRGRSASPYNDDLRPPPAMQTGKSLQTHCAEEITGSQSSSGGGSSHLASPLSSPNRRRLLLLRQSRARSHQDACPSTRSAMGMTSEGDEGQDEILFHPHGKQTENTPFFRLQSPKEVQAGFYIFLLTGICAVSSLLFGYDTGVVSGALLSIRNDLQLSEWEQELIVSITTIGAVVGSLSGGFLTERAGRRPVILLSSVIFTLGAVVMGAAPSFFLLTLGRAVIGLAIGFSSMTVPVYIAEAAPSSIRGRLVTINCIFITGGQFVAGMVDGGFAEVPGGWRYMLGVAAIPAALQFIGVLYLPESPRWLVARGRVNDAKGVLERLRASEDIAFELAEIEEDVAATASLPRARMRDLCTSPPIRRAVTLGCGLMLLQQLSGINTVMYYSASIYNMAGFSDTTSIWLAGFTALAQFVGMLTNMSLVERWGRRTLVLTSLSLVTLSLVAIGASFYLAMASSQPVGVVDPSCARVHNVFVGSFPVTTCFQCVESASCGFCPALGACLPGNKTMDSLGTCPVGDGTGVAGPWAYTVCENPYGYMSVASMVLYLFTFGLGMGAMPWTICAEIFPLHVRSLANSLTTSVNWLGNVIISATFLTIASPHVLTQYGAFWMYAVIALSGLIGLAFTLPETKGVPLEEIEALFIKPGDRIRGMDEVEEGVLRGRSRDWGEEEGASRVTDSPSSSSPSSGPRESHRHAARSTPGGDGKRHGGGELLSYHMG